MDSSSLFKITVNHSQLSKECENLPSYNYIEYISQPPIPLPYFPYESGVVLASWMMQQKLDILFYTVLAAILAYLRSMRDSVSQNQEDNS